MDRMATRTFSSGPCRRNLTSRDKGRNPGSAFARLQEGLQAVQDIFPLLARLFIDLINLGEPIMVEDHRCPVVNRRELPGDAGPGPLRHGAEPVNPAHFGSFVQFGHLKPKGSPPLPKAKLSKRAHLWCDIQIVSPPAS